MRIIQIVTLLSNDGAYGGPLRVALNQVRVLRDRGHDAFILSTVREGDSRLEVVDGVPILLFRAARVAPHRFSGLISADMVRWLRAHVTSADIVHVHAGRDFVTLTSILVTISRARVVLQTHGMVVPSARAIVWLFDIFAMRWALRTARVVFSLTSRETADLLEVEARSRVVQLQNGVAVDKFESQEEKRNEVLFLARLHKRKRPQAFVAAAAELEGLYPDVKWTIIGPDEGELDAVRQQIDRLGLSHVVKYEGTLDYEGAAKRLGGALVYVLPSVDEPFPMSLLEALSLGVPSLCTVSCGIAPVLREADAAVVVEASHESLVSGLNNVLGSATLRDKLSVNARQICSSRFGIESVVDELLAVYERVG